MKRKRNVPAFFVPIALTTALVLIFTAGSARAYVIGANGQPIDQPSTTSSGDEYDLGTSLQNLISPFQNFFNSLKWNNTTSISTAGSTSPMSVPNFTPAVGNFISQEFTSFDDWFYSLTNFRISGLFAALLGVLSWVLGLAKNIVDWLAGLIK